MMNDQHVDSLFPKIQPHPDFFQNLNKRIRRFFPKKIRHPQILRWEKWWIAACGRFSHRRGGGPGDSLCVQCGFQGSTMFYHVLLRVLTNLVGQSYTSVSYVYNCMILYDTVCIIIYIYIYTHIHIIVGDTCLESTVQKAATLRNFRCLRRMRTGCRPNKASKMAEGLKQLSTKQQPAHNPWFATWLWHLKM